MRYFFTSVLQSSKVSCTHHGQIAQSVEQRIENPCVGGSIPPLATICFPQIKIIFVFHCQHFSYSSGKHAACKPVCALFTCMFAMVLNPIGALC